MILQLVLCTRSVSIIGRLVNEDSEPTLPPCRQRLQRIVFHLVHESAYLELVFPLFLLFYELIDITIENVFFIVCELVQFVLFCDIIPDKPFNIACKLFEVDVLEFEEVDILLAHRV